MDNVVGGSAIVSGGAAAWVGALAALALLWVAIGVAIAVIAARRFRLAEQVLEAARVNARLLELMPARPMVVRSGNRIEVDEQLARDLGLGGGPASLSEMTGDNVGILAEDLEALAADIDAAQASSGRVSRTVHTHDSVRVFDVRGGPAPRPGHR